MNKRELVEQVCAALGTTKSAAEETVDCVLLQIQSGLMRDREVVVVGFGAWHLKPRASRIGRNPQTGAALEIPAGYSIGFRAARAWRQKFGPELEREEDERENESGE
jgi:DNA-binding protein HU-beta